MQKKLLIVPISVIMISGLAGCGQDQNANVDRNTNGLQTVGYHSNDGNMMDHDGPLREIIDYSTGNVDYIKNNNNLLPSGNPDDYDHHINSPLTEYNTNNRVVNDNRHLRDINYHGHLNHRNSQARSSYYTAYEGKLAERISNAAAAVSNVSDARTIIDGEKVLVSVVVKNNKKEEVTKRNVKKAVSQYLNGRKYFITSDLGTYYRARQLDNDLRNGGPLSGVGLDIDDMFQAQKINRNQQ